MSHRGIIAAGTDGTRCGTRAVEWAASEAQRRRLPLRIVYVHDGDWHEAQYDIGNEYVDVARQLSEAVAAAAFARARELAPHVSIEADVLIGQAVPTLLEVSRESGLLVLGSRGRGGFAGLMPGSVSRRLADDAGCPVVVVRGRPNPDGPVVVGVDGSRSAGPVLEAAFDAASRENCPLVVVRSSRPAIPLWPARFRPGEVATPERDAAERTVLDEQVALWRAKFPDVEVEIVRTRANAASALVGASHRGRLVVVGGGGRGALLGSAGLRLLHHAGCPVQIVRPDDQRS